MDLPRQRSETGWWQSHPPARAAVYALLYSAVTLFIAFPLANLMYESIRGSLHLPYANTSMLHLLPTQSMLVYLYFLVFSLVSETSPERR